MTFLIFECIFILNNESLKNIIYTMSELNLHGIVMASYEESNAFVSRKTIMDEKIEKIETLETSVEEVVESDSTQDETLAEVEVVNEEQSSEIEEIKGMVGSNADAIRANIEAIKGQEDVLDNLNSSVDSLAEQVDVLTIQGSEILEEMDALKDGVTIEFKDEMEAETSARMEGDASLNARIDAFEGEISSNKSTIEAEVVRAMNAENEAKNMIYEEMSLRETADVELGNKLEDEIEARKAVEEALKVNAEVIAANAKAIDDISSTINSNSEAVTVEATARMEGDASLNEAIASEATARMEGDASLNEALASEAAARMESDREFDLRISEIVSANDIFKSSIDIESSTRETSDNELSSKINDLQAALNKEVIERQSGDSTHTAYTESRLKVEREARVSADTQIRNILSSSAASITSRVMAEEKNRKTADEELRNIDAELMAMDEQINASMEAEEEARKAADEAMDAAVKANALAIASNVEAIGDNATAIKANSEAIAANAEAIVVLNEAVAAETAARTLSVSNLQGEVDNEVNLRSEADAELRALIEAMDLRIKALEEMMSGDNTPDEEEPTEETWGDIMMSVINKTYGSTELTYGYDTVLAVELRQTSSLGNVKTESDFDSSSLVWTAYNPLEVTDENEWEITVKNNNQDTDDIQATVMGQWTDESGELHSAEYYLTCHGNENGGGSVDTGTTVNPDSGSTETPDSGETETPDSGETETWYEPVLRLVNQTYGSTSLNYGIDTVIRLEVEQRSSLGNVRTSVNGDFKEPIISWSVREPLTQTYQSGWEVGIRNDNMNNCPSTTAYIEANWEHEGGSYWTSMTLECWC